MRQPDLEGADPVTPAARWLLFKRERDWRDAEDQSAGGRL